MYHNQRNFVSVGPKLSNRFSSLCRRHGEGDRAKRGGGAGA